MTVPIESAASLYRAMRERGLHLRSGHGRDDALMIELTSRFDVSGRRLQFFLDQSQLSAEQFLLEFMEIARPFALMFREIWEFFNTAGGHRVSESLAIRFGFKHSPMTAAITLEQFRRCVDRIGVYFVSLRVWPDQAIGSLYELYRILLHDTGTDLSKYAITHYDQGDHLILPTIRTAGHVFDAMAKDIRRLFRLSARIRESGQFAEI